MNMDAQITTLDDWRSIREQIRAGVKIKYEWHTQRIYDWRSRCYKRVAVAQADGRIVFDRSPDLLESTNSLARFALIAEYIASKPNPVVTYAEIQRQFGYARLSTASRYITRYPDIFVVERPGGRSCPAEIRLADEWLAACAVHAQTQSEGNKKRSESKNRYRQPIENFLRESGGWHSRTEIAQTVGCGLQAARNNLKHLPVEMRTVPSHNHNEKIVVRWAGD